MPQTIEVPGEGEIEFPDAMSKQEILTALHRLFPKLRPPAALSDTALKYSAGSGLANLIDLPGRGAVAAANLGKMGMGALGGWLGILKPDQLPEITNPDKLAFANQAFRKAGLIDDQYAPNNGPGKVVDFVTQAATGGGINPMALSRNLMRSSFKPVARDIAAPVLSGAFAGLANNAVDNVKTGNQSLDNSIKIGATLAGGMMPGGLMAARGMAGDRAAAMLRDIPPQTLKMAGILKSSANEKGSPITELEAIQRYTGLNPLMQTIQRLAEQSDAASSNLTPMMQNRPKNNAGMLESAVEEISPPSIWPDRLASQLKNAATDAINAARKKGNAQAAPFYDIATNQKLPSAEWNTLTQDPAVQVALQTVKQNKMLGLQNETEGSVKWLDAAKKYLDEVADPSLSATALERTQSAAGTSGARNITNTIDPLIPEYATARGIVAKNREQVVNPLLEGQVGKLAANNVFDTQARALLPRKPKDVNPQVVRNTVDTISAQNPDLIRKFIAQDLRTDFNESNQGTNPMGGAQFQKLISDNPLQKENLISALQSSGAPEAPLMDALDIFHAQKYKPPVGSPTYMNEDQATKLGSFSNAVHPIKIIPSIIQNWRNNSAIGDLANAISQQKQTMPMMIEDLARTNGNYSPLKQQMLINLLLSGNPKNQ